MMAERVSAEAAVCASIYLMGFGLEVMRELRYERYEEKCWHLSVSVEGLGEAEGGCSRDREA
jgi:hypothetical protein